MISAISGLFGLFCLIYVASDTIRHSKKFDWVDWVVNGGIALGATATLWTAVF